MSEFLNALIIPRQRRRHVQAELERLTPGVLYMGQLDRTPFDLSRLEWAECREGVFVRWTQSLLDLSAPRILSGRLNCPVLLAYLCDGAFWGCALFYKGSPVDHFRTAPGLLHDGFTDSAPPERRAAWLAQYFPAGREDLLPYLVPWTPEELAGAGDPVSPQDAHPRGDGWQLSDFLSTLAPWTRDMLTSDQLTTAPAAPAPDRSSPKSNAPDRQRQPEAAPGPEACLPFLAGVKVLRPKPSFPLSLFSKHRPVPETVPHDGWTRQELSDILDQFCSGALDRLELDFTVYSEGAYVRRLGKAFRRSYRLTLVLIREAGRCMCLLLDDQESALHRLIADRDTYMTVDSKDLEKTTFHGQTVNQYVVFPQPCPAAIRPEVDYLLARLDRRDDVLSPTRRMGVWSGDVPMTNTEAAKRQHQENRQIWCFE